MSRPISAQIDLNALKHNLSRVRQYAKHSRVMAVIKANAYGHGLIHVAKAFNDIDAFALLELEAAIKLREAGIRQPILLLEGFFSRADLALIDQYRLDTVIHHEDQIAMLSDLRTERKINIFLKINTGMNRLGFTPQDGYKAIDALRNLYQTGKITLMTHLACADDPATYQEIIDQLSSFTNTFFTTNLHYSLANSAAIIQYPQAHQQWVRPGIMLYGGSPLIHKTAAELDLQPVMTVSSKIIAVQQLNTNDKVGYSGIFQANQPMQIGIVAAGYADGYPRHAPTGTPIIVNNQRTRIVGRVSMDMLAVDLTGITNAVVGSPVILWGKQLPIEEVAKAAGTISYELFCALSSRVKVITTE